MTPDDLAAIRARAEGYPWYDALNILIEDRDALLAEVDRLRGLIHHYGEGAPSLPGAEIASAERARIRAAVEGLEKPAWVLMTDWDAALRSVLAAIDGEA